MDHDFIAFILTKALNPSLKIFLFIGTKDIAQYLNISIAQMVEHSLACAWLNLLLLL